MRNLVLTAMASAMLATAPARATNLYVFGDSLVDAGNVAVATGGTTPNPAQGYFQGRFNNGLNYVDYLNQRFAGTNTAPSLLGGTNFAFGGARAVGSAYGGYPVPGLPQQLTSYFSATGGAADPNGLYVINFGGNDLFGLGTGDTGGLDANSFAALAIGNIVGSVQALSAAGAGKILVTGIPVGGVGGAAVEAGLQAALTGIEPTLTAKLYRFSYLDFYTRVAIDPQSYNLGPAPIYNTPCIAAQPVMNGKIDCRGYFSFDGTHFTAQVQRGIARDITQVLGVPEPASWAMFILGFGLTGLQLRRRRHAMTPA